MYIIIGLHICVYLYIIVCILLYGTVLAGGKKAAYGGGHAGLVWPTTRAN